MKSDLELMQSQKETYLQAKERDIKEQLAMVEAKREELVKREERVLEQEASVKDKRNQLFRSYDMLTEKMCQLEQECDKLKAKKRHMAV